MKIRTALMCSAVCMMTLAGCIRETTHEELADILAEYQRNTLPTVIYYTGSDESHDYFHFDVPLGKNDTVKVAQQDTRVTNRFPITRKKNQWQVYNPYPRSTIHREWVIDSHPTNRDDE